jgi:hypothetical protein
MKKKKKHLAPMQYRIKYRAGSWAVKSTRYYNVLHSSEALEDIYHTFHSGKIHAKKITIYKIEEYNRFTDKWINRTEEALENIENLDDMKIDSNKVIMHR